MNFQDEQLQFFAIFQSVEAKTDRETEFIQELTATSLCSTSSLSYWFTGRTLALLLYLLLSHAYPVTRFVLKGQGHEMDILLKV
jgi:hypothetical protein